MDKDPSFQFGFDETAPNAKAKWLRRQGFEVFQYPYLPVIGQVNRMPELSSGEANFTTVSVTEFDSTPA